MFFFFFGPDKFRAAWDNLKWFLHCWHFFFYFAMRRIFIVRNGCVAQTKHENIINIKDNVFLPFFFFVFVVARFTNKSKKILKIQAIKEIKYLIVQPSISKLVFFPFLLILDLAYSLFLRDWCVSINFNEN